LTQRRGTSPKRGTRWIDTTITTSLGTGSAVNFSLLGGLGLDDIPGLIIIRTLVTLTVLPDGAVAGFGEQLILAGAGIVTGDAFAAIALPDLNAVSEEPVRGWMFKTSGVVAASPLEEQFGVVWRVEGDFRSMRKLDLDTECFIQFRSILLNGLAIMVRIGGLIRLLVKLP